MTRTMLALGLGLFAAQASALDLDWMAGDWCGGENGGATQETWTTGAGGLLLGMHKDHEAGGRTAFEFLRVEVEGERAAYVSQPGGQPPTRFELIEHGPDNALFANPQHDFPKRIGYRREDKVLRAWIDDGIEGGQAMHWQWRRCFFVATK